MPSPGKSFAGSAASNRERQTVTDHRLCALNDIPDPGSAGFDVKVRDYTIRLMVIRQGDHVHIYENRCPHRRLPLDFKP